MVDHGLVVCDRVCYNKAGYLRSRSRFRGCRCDGALSVFRPVAVIVHGIPLQGWGTLELERLASGTNVVLSAGRLAGDVCVLTWRAVDLVHNEVSSCCCLYAVVSGLLCWAVKRR